MVYNIIHIFATRLSAIDGINRQSITFGYHAQWINGLGKENTRYAVKLSRVSFYNLTIQAQTNLAEYSNCVAREREVSFATYLTVWGLNEKSIRVLRHEKQCKKPERMTTLSTGSPESDSYDWYAYFRVNEVCIAEQLNTFIPFKLQTYFLECIGCLRSVTNQLIL